MVGRQALFHFSSFWYYKRVARLVSGCICVGRLHITNAIERPGKDALGLYAADCVSHVHIWIIRM